MVGLFRELEIEWAGKTYQVTPSMRILKRIENGGVSLTMIVFDILQGQPKFSLIAAAVAELLRSAGATLSEDDVYEEIMGSDPQAARRACDFVIAAVSPQTDGKKPEALSDA